MNKPRNYGANHMSWEGLEAVTNHEDGTCSFKIDTIPEKGTRSIDVMQGDRKLFSISISENGVCYQVLEAGSDVGVFTIWEDEV